METTLSENTQEVATPAETTVQNDVQADNWREVNQLLKEQKAAIERQERENAELKSMLQQALTKPPQEEMDEPMDVYAEDFGQKLERKLERSVEKALLKVEEKRRNDPAYLEEQARKKYSDFESVMTPENIDTIIKSNPLVYNAVMNSGKPLDAAYELIKGSAAYQSKLPKATSTMDRLAQEERQKLAENANKPKSPHQAARSQTISNVMGFRRLSPSQAAEVHAETLRIKRGR